MSEYCLNALKDAGISEIAIIIGGIASNKVKEYYGSGEQFGVNITYVVQDEPHGIAHAINLCKNFINNEKFIVFLGDNIIKKDISEYRNEFEKSEFAASILLCEVDNPTQFGIADLNSDGSIKKIMEKPKEPPTNLAVTGIYFLTPKIFDVISRLKPSWRNELEITDALQMLLEEENKIGYYMITDYWKDTGTPNDIIHANKVILEDMKPYFKGIKEDNVTIEGNLMVGENSIIKSGTKIIGPIIIGKNCVIGPDVIIGKNTSIGDDSQISKCEIEDSIIMNGCKIESKIKIKNSIIAFNSNIKQSDSDNKIFLLGEGTNISL